MIASPRHLSLTKDASSLRRLATATADTRASSRTARLIEPGEKAIQRRLASSQTTRQTVNSPSAFAKR